MNQRLNESVFVASLIEIFAETLQETHVRLLGSFFRRKKLKCRNLRKRLHSISLLSLKKHLRPHLGFVY